MIIAAANNQFLTAIHGTAVDIYTDPIPMGSNNYGNAVMNAHALFAGAGTPAVTLTFTLQESNDGQTFTDVSGFTASMSSAAVPVKDSGQLTAAFIRVKFNLTVTGGAGDWGCVAFDLHLNLTRV